MVESLPTMVDMHIKEQVKKQVPKQVRDQVPVYVAEGLILERQKTKKEMERMIAKAILQEHGNIQAEISSQIQNAIDNHIPSQVDASQDIAIWLALQMKFERLQVPQTTCRTSAIRPRDQDDPHDDAHPEGENSNQEQVDDYDFWTDFYASDDDEIPTKQVSQDIMQEVSLTIDEAKLKKMADEMLRQRCTSGDEHQYHIDQMKNFLKSDIFPAIIFNDDDIEERTSRWVNKCVKKFNPYARYGVEHWKNSHAKIFYTKKQKKPRKLKEEPDYKNLNKNDIEDMYLLIMNGKVPDYIETGLLWSLSVLIRRVEKHKIVLEGLKSYNNDVKCGYVQRELTNDEVEYLKFFEEEIEVRLKYRNQMRRWEMYVNGRPLGPRRKRPE
ncbi:hypothetical protein Tco_1378171 [Tanacetum coccineum]